MFAAVILTPNGYANVPCPGGAYPKVGGYESLNVAKKAVATFINEDRNGGFKDGYDAYVLDTEKGIVASRATVEAPSLTWKDSV